MILKQAARPHEKNTRGKKLDESKTFPKKTKKLAPALQPKHIEKGKKKTEWSCQR